MKRWIKLIGVLVVSAFVLAACGSSSTSGDAETYTVGATQIVEHPSLDRAYEGFQAALKDAGLDVKYNYQNAQDDPNNVKTISDNFVADDVDLIFANSTPSALGALQATSEIPIVFTSVTDAVETGIVESMDEPGGNVTGVIDLHPDAIQDTIDFIDTYFEGATVGLIYNAGEQNAVIQVEAAEAAGEGTSLSFILRTVATSADVQQAATTLIGEADVIYIVTDNTVVEALESVVGVANEHGIPLIVGEPDSLAKGGFATYGIDYYTIGYRTGEMAADILTGKKTTLDLPVEIPPKIGLFINKGAAEAQGIEWNKAWDDAEFVETE